jgi:Ca2+-binding RTX toxin-like protein
VVPSTRRADVAQLVERRLPKPKVAGSNPVVRSSGIRSPRAITPWLSSDLLLGQNGNDTLSALAGPDLLCGGRGNDGLTGGAGPDRFSGGQGADTATDLSISQLDTQDGTIPEPGRTPPPSAS